MPPVLPFDLLIDECIISLSDIHIFIPDLNDRHCGICYNDYYNTSISADQYSQASQSQTTKKPSKLRKIKSRFFSTNSYYSGFFPPAWRSPSSINDSRTINDPSAFNDDGRIEIPIILPCGHHMGMDCLLKMNPANLNGTTGEENNKCPFCRHQLFAKGSDRPGWRPERPRQPARYMTARPGLRRHPVDTGAPRVTRGDEESTEQQALLGIAKHLLVVATCFILSCLRYGLKLIIKKLADYLTAHEDAMAEHYGLTIM